MFELWGSGKTYEELFENIKKFEKKYPEKYNHFLSENVTFKFIVEIYGRHYHVSKKLEIIEKFKWMNFKGKVRMKDPEVEFYIFEEFDRLGIDDGSPPKMIYFARFISGSRRDLVDSFTLKRRKYLGTTSMESEISFFSVNQGLVKNGSLVLDPFVGTGSLIVSAAYFGAKTFGCDIDAKVLLGKDNKNIYDNFKQYNLEMNLFDLIRLDYSSNHAFRDIPMFDAIITDPPYGIRAGAKKVGVKSDSLTRKETGHTRNPDDEPQCIPYSVGEVLTDLLDFSARNLVKGGRLVFWLPSTRDFKESDIPTHPCLQLISNSEEPLSLRWSRRLITMEKIIDFDPALHSNFKIEFEIPTDVSYSDISAKVLNDNNRMDRRYDPNFDKNYKPFKKKQKVKRTRAERRELKKAVFSKKTDVTKDS